MMSIREVSTMAKVKDEKFSVRKTFCFDAPTWGYLCALAAKHGLKHNVSEYVRQLIIKEAVAEAIAQAADENR